MLRPDIGELDVTALDPLPHEMVPDVDMLGPLMLYRVLLIAMQPWLSS